jgi:hypothetical protein
MLKHQVKNLSFFVGKATSNKEFPLAAKKEHSLSILPLTLTSKQGIL